MYTTFGSPVGFVGICTALFVMTSLWEDETFELVITPRFDECRRVVVVKEEEDEFFLEDKEEEDFCWCCTNTCCEADKDEDIIVIQVFAKERVFTCVVCESARAAVESVQISAARTAPIGKSPRSERETAGRATPLGSGSGAARTRG